MKSIQRRYTLLLLLSLTAVASAATDWDIYLVGGQSNAVGWGTNKSGLPVSLQGDQTDVQFFNGTGGSWGYLAPGSGNTADAFGPEITLGRTLADENPTRNIALIKYAVGGTDLAIEWNPDDAGINQYDHFMTTFNNAVGSLAVGDTYTVKAMAWMQGEKDSGDASKAANYQANLANLINHVRADTGAADMHFSVGQLAYHATSTYWTTVQNAQAAVAANDPNVSLVVTAGLPQDAIHFTNDGQQTLGERFAAAIQGQNPTIQITNGDFESPLQPNDGAINTGNASGWQESGGTNGTFNPNTSFYTNTNILDASGGVVGDMDKENVLFFANDTDQSVMQTLSAVAEVGTTYELTVAVGDRDAGSRTAFAGYRIELLSGGVVLAALVAASDASPGDGTFTDVTLSYTVLESDPLGELGIRIGTNGAAAGRATDFDGVSLVATPVPEPATMSLLALGGMAMLRRRKK